MKSIASPQTPQQRRRQRGITFIELMIGVAVVSLLATTALPAYQGVVRKARRAEALSTLGQLQLAQERWYADHARYADSAADIGIKLGSDGKTSGGHYVITLDNVSAAGYVASATAQGGQTEDAKCRVLRLTIADNGFTYSSLDAKGHEDKDGASRCWLR